MDNLPAQEPAPVPAPAAGAVTSAELDFATAPPLLSPPVGKLLAAVLAMPQPDSSRPVDRYVLSGVFGDKLPAPSLDGLDGLAETLDYLAGQPAANLMRMTSTPLEVVLASKLQQALEEVAALEKLVLRS